MFITPLFIVFEGIDGSGKSTQAAMLYQFITSLDIEAVKLAEPTDGAWGRKIREMLSGDVLPPAETQLDMFIKDREDDVQNNVNPAMAGKKIIIMDRYFYSNAAYQGASGISPLSIIAENLKRNFPVPDRVYFIDIDPEEAMKRINKRSSSGTDLFEKESFLARVRQSYLEVADDRFLIIDGSGKEDDIFKEIMKDMKGHFSENE